MHFRWNLSMSRVLASSLAALAATTSLCALPKGPCDSKAPEVCCDEPKPGPFAFSYPMDMGLSCPRDFYAHIDGLYMQAKEDGLEFVIKDSNGSGSGAISQGRVQGFSDDHSDFDYNPGMRFGIGFYMDHDAWQLDFNWTWLNITNYKHGNQSTSGGTLIPLTATGEGTPAGAFGTRSSAVWKTSYNTLDASLCKPFHVSRYLVMAPFFGLRAGWIDQHFSVDLGGSSSTSRTITHADNDFWGVGSRAGLNTDWILGKGWCLFGNVAFSMLFGSFEIDQNMTYPSAISSVGDGFDITNDFYQNVPNMEIILGIGWGKHFDKDKYHIGLRAAYEFHEWWDQLNIRKFMSGSSGQLSGGTYGATGAYANDAISRGNLTLNGFSLKLMLDI